MHLPATATISFDVLWSIGARVSEFPVTLNAARALHMTDRGEIRAGLRGDLIAVRRHHAGLPLVERVWSAGDPIFRFGTR